MSGAKYPITRLLAKIISDHASSEGEFITEVLGYRNVEKGLRRLHFWTEEGGEGAHQRIIGQIAQASGRGEELERAIAATREMKAKECEAAFLERCRGEAETFRPFLCPIGSQSVPEGICIFGMTGGHRRWTKIEIPQSVLDLTGDDLFLALLPYMIQYKNKYNGCVPFFSTLTGFRFVRLIDYFQFTADGQLAEHVNKPYRLGTCSVRLG
jgi:hypothetical protein